MATEGHTLRWKRARIVPREEVLHATVAILESDGLLAVSKARLADVLLVPEEQLGSDLPAITAEAYRGLAGQELASVRRTILTNPSPAEQMRALLHWLAAPPAGSASKHGR